jgi:ribosome-associated heat shock protein Hsp15
MTDDTVRLDKWLWAARFFKTRSAATEAVAGGKVEVNDQRPKPAHPVRSGDTIRVRLPPFEHIVVVTGMAERRGSAAAAAALFQETDASLAARERLREQHRLAPSLQFTEGKPSKKERRAYEKVRGRKS